MFTGLIQGQGTIESADNRGSETRFRIRALYDLENIVLGESIAINGTCLTVETFGDRWFTAYASRETLSVTSLGSLKTGSTVNIERAMAMGDRFGGHIVAGHVDCLATVESVRPEGESKIYRLVFDKEHGPFVIPKGSITLDGISLTINSCGEDWLEVNIIPETQSVTTISQWSAGRKVNMETDVIGKYVQRMLGAWLPGGAGKPAESKITPEFLAKHGF